MTAESLKWMVSLFYVAGTWVDKRLTKTQKLSCPVISVGNIAVGGRGKTPFVIWLTQWFQTNGWNPVILTRGYGRSSKSVVEIEKSMFEQKGSVLTSDLAGDEPIEIAAATGATVLVGSDRLANAQSYLRKHPELRTIFLLDDGFQHWKIARDFDLVLVDHADLRDYVIPAGRLREPPGALKRAQLVLERGKDFQKQSHLISKPEDSHRLAFVTSRAPDPMYRQDLSYRFPKAHWIEFSDHAPAEVIRERLARDGITSALVGAKEAVKLLPPHELKEFFRTGKAQAILNSRTSIQLHYVACKLKPGMKTNFAKLWEEAWHVAGKHH